MRTHAADGADMAGEVNTGHTRRLRGLRQGRCSTRAISVVRILNLHKGAPELKTVGSEEHRIGYMAPAIDRACCRDRRR